MTKTISQKLREHALGPLGARHPVEAEDDAVFEELMRQKPYAVSFHELSGVERRMLALFVAESRAATS